VGAGDQARHHPARAAGPGRAAALPALAGGLRTVTYTAVTALLAVPYLVVIPAACQLAAGSGSLAVAAAALAEHARVPAVIPIR
jgi:hypothetical protein